MPQFRSILVPVDFSRCSDRALEMATSLAEALGARLELVHVWEPPRLESAALATVSGHPIEEYARKATAPKMEQLLARIPPTLRDRVQGRFEVGQPWERVVARAKLHDLVVMGANGHTGRVRSMAGSVAESVVRLSPTPVLTVKDLD
ncbi:MAG TPA: universal stress protein [Polyangiaceae bacterium]